MNGEKWEMNKIIIIRVNRKWRREGTKCNTATVCGLTTSFGWYTFNAVGGFIAITLQTFFAPIF